MDAGRRRGDFQPAARSGACLPRRGGRRAGLPGRAQLLHAGESRQPRAGRRVPGRELLALADPAAGVRQRGALGRHGGRLLPFGGLPAVPNAVRPAQGRPAHGRRRADLVETARAAQGVERAPRGAGRRGGSRGGPRPEPHGPPRGPRRPPPAHALHRPAALEPPCPVAAVPAAHGRAVAGSEHGPRGDGHSGQSARLRCDHDETHHGLDLQLGQPLLLPAVADLVGSRPQPRPRARTHHELLGKGGHRGGGRQLRLHDGGLGSARRRQLSHARGLLWDRDLPPHQEHPERDDVLDPGLGKPRDEQEQPRGPGRRGLHRRLHRSADAGAQRCLCRRGAHRDLQAPRALDGPGGCSRGQAGSRRQRPRQGVALSAARLALPRLQAERLGALRLRAPGGRRRAERGRGGANLDRCHAQPSACGA
mmetsp:Transcript_24713/g.76887  ORF Transcript_24713/g.76887 Transcript_24713/m.76887 type:complete len:422 (-) Transcript_24713:277-1542(-)